MKAPPEARIVVIRHRHKYSGAENVLAWWLRRDGDDLLVRHRLNMVGGYRPKPVRVPLSCVIRDATPRERDLGRVQPEVRT
jgi:hypothetical protein